MSSESHTSGYEVPDVNRGGRIIGGVLATTIPTLIVVGLRFYVRVFILNHVNVSVSSSPGCFTEALKILTKGLYD